MVDLSIFPKPSKKKRGKTKKWESARKHLKVEYQKKGITRCEIGLIGCWRTNALSFAHRYKRRDPRCSHTYQGTILACIPCHQRIEGNKELTNYYFNLLR